MIFTSRFTIRNKSLLMAMASVFGCVNWLGLGYAQTTYEADFDATFPTFGYSYDFSGYGDPVAGNIVTDEQTQSSYDVLTPPAATATLDTSQWTLPGNQTYTYTGWGLGIVFYFPEGRRPTSGDLSQYTLSFDASVTGYDEDFALFGLETPITVIFQGPEFQTDEFTIGVNNNNRGNFLEVPRLTSTVQSFSIPLSDFALLSDTTGANYWDFPTMFADTQQILVQLQPSTNAADIGIDSDNIVTVDNVRIEGPFAAPPDLAGDYDQDGDVDENDYTTWQQNFGAIGADLPSDGNENGEVDAADYVVWRSNFDSAAGLQLSAVVPEPTAWSLALVALLAASVLRSLRR